MRIFSLFIPLLFSIQLAIGQQSNLKENYKTSEILRFKNVNNKTILNIHTTPHWLEDGSGFWFTEFHRGGYQVMKYHYKTKKKTPLFDHNLLARLLTDTLNESIDNHKLPIKKVSITDKNTLYFQVKGNEYRVNLKNYTFIIKNEKKEFFKQNESTSPDGKYTALVKGYNLYLRNESTGISKQLSFDGTEQFTYASWYGWGDLIVGEQGKRKPHFWVNWSPDSKFFQSSICDTRNAQKMHLLNWSIDTLYRPQLNAYFRGSPGDTTLVKMIPQIYSIDTEQKLSIDLPTTTHINPIQIHWYTKNDLAFVQWSKRGYKEVNLFKIDLKNEVKELIYQEKSKTNIDNFSVQKHEKTNSLFLTSEKSGWKQLYQFRVDENTLHSIDSGNYFVEEIKYIDHKKQLLYYTASGKELSRNPYHHHLYSFSFKTGKTMLLTLENAHHQIYFSPDGKYFLDNFSTLNQPTKTILRKCNGEYISTIIKSDIKEYQKKCKNFPETFNTISRDNKTVIYGALWKPSHFDSTKTYPIIDHSYTGPHTQMYPRSFRRALGLDNQSLAELGFIVVVIDGIGSQGRSKEFHDHSYKNLGNNLTDHVKAIRQLGEKHTWIDTTRVGIFGHSAGGYDAAHALLVFPDFYKVAVASSADHDHRMEKAWWPEMYMGWPVDSTYHLQSNVTLAKNLKGKLLLVHGGMDENVNPSATFKLSEELIKANKEFDLLILPSQRHSYRGKYREYFIKKRANYFVKHLLMVEPIW